MPILRISSRVQVYGDVVPGQLAEPLQRYVDWERFASGMPVREAISDRRIVESGQTLTLANVTTITGIAAGATYSFKAHPSKSGRYQIRYVSGAAMPQLTGLSTSIATVGHSYSVVTQDDGSIVLTDTFATPGNFGLIRGDKVYLAGSAFGDTGPWSASNQGFWTVVACSASGIYPGAKLTLKRVESTDSVGVDESAIVATATADIQKIVPVVSALIVGVAPYSSAYSGVWEVVESAKGWFSIDSLTTLPDILTDIPTALTLAQNDFLGYFRVEVDAAAVVKTTSGDLTQGSQVLRPVVFSDPLATPVGGWMELYGFMTNLQVQNVSDGPVSVNVILAYLES